MELPDDVLRLIKEYSMPITRADWRDLHLMNNMRFLCNIATTYNYRYLQVIHRFVNNYEDTINTKYKYIRYSHQYARPIAYVVLNKY